MGEQHRAVQAVGGQDGLRQRAAEIDPDPGKILIRVAVVNLVGSGVEQDSVPGGGGKQPPVGQQRAGAAADILNAGNGGWQPQLIAGGAGVGFPVFGNQKRLPIAAGGRTADVCGQRRFQIDEIHGDPSRCHCIARRRECQFLFLFHKESGQLFPFPFFAVFRYNGLSRYGKKEEA